MTQDACDSKMECDLKGDISARFGRWVRASPALAKFELIAIVDVCEIGQIDRRCIIEDKRICSYFGNDLEVEKNLNRDNFHYLISKLWVLAAYELIRVIRVRCQETKDIVNEGLFKKIEELEQKFLRLRVPLVKKEASIKNPNDFRNVVLAIDPHKGVFWWVSKDDKITRKELSDELLLILEEIQQTG